MNTNELDIRWPIGLLFLVLGALVAVYGGIAGQSAHPVSVIDFAIFGRHFSELNLNLIWGAVMAIFGLLMTWAAHRASRRAGPGAKRL